MVNLLLHFRCMELTSLYECAIYRRKARNSKRTLRNMILLLYPSRWYSCSKMLNMATHSDWFDT